MLFTLSTLDLCVICPPAQAELEDEFVFPITVEDGSVVDLVMKATDNVEAKVKKIGRKNSSVGVNLYNISSLCVPFFFCL